MNGNTKQSTVGFLKLAGRAAIICAVLLNGYAVSAQMVSKPFSADKVVTKRGTTTTSKVYATSTATRTDGEQRGKKFIAITRWDRKVLWSIMPDQKMYVEMQIPVGSESAGAMNELAKGMMKDAQVKRESLGTEQVEGFQCDKTRMTVTWQGITGTTTEWAAKELGGFVLKKQDDTTGELTEYENIQLGPQDPSLFELPAGYQKMSLGGFQKPQN
jgi:hypothetical protein